MFCARCGTWAPDDTATCALCGLVLLPGHPSAASPPGLAAVPPAPAARVEPFVSYGGFWRRFLALVLDMMVLFFPAAIVRALLGVGPMSLFDPLTPGAYTAAAFEFTLDWLYAAILISSRARGTLGMQVMDLQVTSLAGDRISFARATWRYFAQFVSVLTFFLGYFMQLFTPRRQTLHDLLSSTVVVRPRPVPAAAAAPLPRPAP